MTKFAALEIPVDVPARLILRHPVTMVELTDKAKNSAYVDLLSTDSQAAREFERVKTDQALSAPGRARTSYDEIERNAIEKLAALTCGWYLVGLDGPPLEVPFSKENTQEFYAAPGMAWVVEQVQLFIGARANFVKPSSPR